MSTAPHERLRIVLGTTEISGNIRSIAAALRQRGHEVLTIVDAHSVARYDARDYDRVVSGGRWRRVLSMAGQLLRVARSHDTFFFVWRNSFLPFQIDYLLLRLMRKRVLVLYCGDDIRFRPAQLALDRQLSRFAISADDPRANADYLAGGSSFWRVLLATKAAEKTGATILAARDTASFQGRDYVLSKIPQPQLTDGPRTPAPVPLLLHAPTYALGKGTSQVLAAVEALRAAGVGFEFELIEDRPNSYVIERMAEADVVIDAPANWISRVTLEALASSCAVVGGNQPQYAGWPDESPVVQFEPDVAALTATLRELIEDRERRAELMAASFDYWRRMYSEHAFADYLDAVLAGQGPVMHPVPDQRATALRATTGRARKLALRLLW